MQNSIAVVIAVLVVAAGGWWFWRWRERRQHRLISLVALLREPVTLDPAVVARAADVDRLRNYFLESGSGHTLQKAWRAMEA